MTYAHNDELSRSIRSMGTSRTHQYLCHETDVCLKECDGGATCFPDRNRLELYLKAFLELEDMDDRSYCEYGDFPIRKT